MILTNLRGGQDVLGYINCDFNASPKMCLTQIQFLEHTIICLWENA